MLHLITESSKYVMIFLFMIYTYYSFAVLSVKNEARQRRMCKSQTTCMMLIHLDAFLVLFAAQMQIKILIFYAAQVAFVLFLFLIYRVIYRRAARLVVNHMCMLMIIGFIILTRLNLESAIKQFEIAVIASVVTIFVPQLVRKLKFLRKFTWVYCAIGILALGVVLVLGQMTGGAYLSFTIAGITFQPSEFVKIIFVFFVACMLYQSTDFKQVCITTVAAAIHVLILVVSTDLGAALIFFITYIVMLYAATKKPLYFFGGLGVGCLAAVAAKLFSHVRVRVTAWLDPFGNISGSGWQVAQSLFAIGTGGWFGLGLYQGLPEKIPVGSSDFVFAAIVEEMGEIFGICIILVCLSCFLMFLNIAMQLKDPFYRLIALGLGCVYGVQVFLNIGGVIKCIPSTGLTLPLISYGGSSILCTIIMFAIIQGLYILRQDEGEADEQRKKRLNPRRYRDSGSGRQSERKKEEYTVREDNNKDRYGRNKTAGNSGKNGKNGKSSKNGKSTTGSSGSGRSSSGFGRKDEIEEIW
ncbi:MAG: FtsW/RodA/SpoVE family cell cycle protein [Lachnospiraceae bacterium]|nr:FtsW/RodA/SpoVE family cell cycle protein [Lachnospiraceae bacterium]